jgi:redox-sensitive bicupin YhaK (pirin superfamily)
MLNIRRSNERGRSRFDWLQSSHTFSFGGYYDPRHMGYGPLRVINDDRVIPGAGFATHPHRDMEIISYVLDGALEHRDSMGNGSVIRPGDVQRMSAGTGVTHSEYNHSKESAVHFLQIWFLPEKSGLQPGYEQKSFAEHEKRGRFRLVASRNGMDGSVSLNQDVNMRVGLFHGDESDGLEIVDGRSAWLHIARGHVRVNGEKLQAGDGASVERPGRLRFGGGADAEVIVFDMQGEP